MNANLGFCFEVTCWDYHQFFTNRNSPWSIVLSTWNILPWWKNSFQLKFFLYPWETWMKLKKDNFSITWYLRTHKFIPPGTIFLSKWQINFFMDSFLRIVRHGTMNLRKIFHKAKMVKYSKRTHRMGQFPDAIHKCLPSARTIKSIKLARKKFSLLMKKNFRKITRTQQRRAFGVKISQW